MSGKCGTCTACCKVFAIPQLNKPAGRWCEHCAIGEGCKIYEERPKICADFTCMWLESYNHGVDWPEEMRPDRCKVVFSPSTQEGLIAATVMPGNPDAWRKGVARKIIDKLLKNGTRVVVGPPISTTKILIDKYGEYEVQMTEPDENGMQWNIPPSTNHKHP